MAIQNGIRWCLVLILFGFISSSFLTSCGSGSETHSSDSGKALYLENCAVCHGEDGKLGVSGAKDLTLSRLSDNEVLQRIMEGKNGMPPMKSVLETKENVSAVAEYVKGMRK